MTQNIKKNIESIQEKINFFCNKYGRHSQDVNWIAVSKYQPIEKIIEAYNCGISDFGENYIQEWQKKVTELNAKYKINWHLIGAQQSNKAKFIDNNIFCLQSLNSIKLANEIEKKANLNHELNTLVQLQIDPEDNQKSGIDFESANRLCEFIAQSKKLSLKGFMGIGPLQKSNKELKFLYTSFAKNSENLWQKFSTDKTKKCILSLGMSQDLEIAIECGSTLLRIGTAVFGERSSHY